MDIITGDGGFDFSVDFNQQEAQIARLLFGQMAFALSMQKRGGSFILKIFDCFMQPTLDILAILSACYEKVYLTKPQTSRYANSEKYIVCRGFLYTNIDSILPFLRNTIKTMTDPDNEHLWIGRFLRIPLSLYFCTRLEEFNAICGQQQIENIHYTLALIENKYKHEKIENLIKVNTQRSINWCIKHNIPYYSLNQSMNIFLDSVSEIAIS